MPYFDTFIAIAKVPCGYESPRVHYMHIPIHIPLTPSEIQLIPFSYPFPIFDENPHHGKHGQGNECKKTVPPPQS